MLLTLAEIGVELMMVIAVVGSTACLAFLIRANWLDWRDSRRRADRHLRSMTTAAPRKQAPYSASAPDTESRRGGAR